MARLKYFSAPPASLRTIATWARLWSARARAFAVSNSGTRLQIVASGKRLWLFSLSFHQRRRRLYQRRLATLTPWSARERELAWVGVSEAAEALAGAARAATSRAVRARRFMAL